MAVVGLQLHRGAQHCSKHTSSQDISVEASLPSDSLRHRCSFLGVLQTRRQQAHQTGEPIKYTRLPSPQQRSGQRTHAGLSQVPSPGQRRASQKAHGVRERRRRHGSCSQATSVPLTYWLPLQGASAYRCLGVSQLQAAAWVSHSLYAAAKKSHIAAPVC